MAADIRELEILREISNNLAQINRNIEDLNKNLEIANYLKVAGNENLNETDKVVSEIPGICKKQYIIYKEIFNMSDEQTEKYVKKRMRE